MNSLIKIKKDDVSIFECPISSHLNEEYDYFIFDQDDRLICSVTAAITLIEYLRQKEGKKCEKFSVGFLYHNAIIANRDFKQAQTVGLKATSVLSAILKYGACLEQNWDNLDPLVKPSDEAIIDSLSRIKHTNIENIEPCIETIRYTIGFCKRPIVACLNIYNRHKFFNKETSYELIHCPTKSEKTLIQDRHTIVLVGYSDSERCIYFQNSYGKEWGNNGFGRISYDYIPYFGILYSMDESCLKSDNFDMNDNYT